MLRRAKGSSKPSSKKLEEILIAITNNDNCDDLKLAETKPKIITFTQQTYSTYKESDISRTLTASSGTVKGGGDTIVAEKQKKWRLRRLTPLECERIQGFPDNWTNIGEYVDESGKKRNASDTARYKALGNSIALPQWEWIVKKMKRFFHDKNATIGSLFDGIGGFPLVWEKTYGKNTALWASEIEAFPIAVTKKHFPEK